jgi:hypothetical protein
VDCARSHGKCAVCMNTAAGVACSYKHQDFYNLSVSHFLDRFINWYMFMHKIQSSITGNAKFLSVYFYKGYMCRHRKIFSCPLESNFVPTLKKGCYENCLWYFFCNYFAISESNTSQVIYQIILNTKTIFFFCSFFIRFHAKSFYSTCIL